MPSDATQLRLDYKDISAGELVIVIHGLPTALDDPLTRTVGDARIAVGSGSNGNSRQGIASSPLVVEAEAVGGANGYAPALFTHLLRAAWRGREVLALELIDASIEEAAAEDVGRATAITEYVKAVLYNGLGRYQDALGAAQHACAHEGGGLVGRALLELVEAGTRSNADAVASEALAQLDERASADGTEWDLGVRARSAALLSGGDRAERLYHEAIELLDRSRAAVHLARAQLVYGEWLRRENRRVAAREQLRSAHEMFSGIGAEAFAERARRELMASGETARRRTDDRRGELTPQEAQIARLAQDGLSNPEIGAQLYISPRTVQYHLRKVFLKLQITSRNQLGRFAASSLQST
jgi:DNA-binding CsgD family transcriptional regulator